MVETYIEAVVTIRVLRERRGRGHDYAHGLDSLIDVGQGTEFRVGRGSVNGDGTVEPRASDALPLGKCNRNLYISA